MKSITVIYKQSNLLYDKKSVTEKSTLFFTVHSHQLFLILINQKYGYIFFT